MNATDKNIEIVMCDKLINRYILRGRKFVEYACFQYGKFSHLLSKEPDAGYVNDFQYFVFTKSTKTLESIRKLLHMGHTEDVFVLVRTMFEGYLASRYINEAYEDSFLNDFIFIPQLIAGRKIIYDGGSAHIRGTEEIVEFLQRNPSQMKLGRDRKYFNDLYAFLCDFAHCNFSILYCYGDKGCGYTCDNVVNEFLARIIVLFVFTKIFESIVTVEGEEFLNEREEKECYRLVEEATQYLYRQLDYFSKYDKPNAGDELNSHMKRMFKKMKKSLKEEIGSINKDCLI